MTKDEAKREILRAFKEWVGERGETLPYRGTDGGRIFFNQLESSHSPLLSFRSPANKWTLVQGWLNRAGLTQ